MTTAKIECPKCHRKYNVPERNLGRKVVCANESCGEKFLATVFQPAKPVEEFVEVTVEPDEEFVEVTIDESPSSRKGRSSPNKLAPAMKVPQKKATKSIAAFATGMIGLIGLVIIGIGLMMVIGNAISKSVVDETPPTLPESRNIAANPFVELLTHTDSTIRLLKVTDDKELARQYLVKWKTLRQAIGKSDQTEMSLDVIEGHLNAIHEKLYPREGNRRDMAGLGWRNANEWSNHKDSMEAIRAAQTQVMKQLKITWDETQPPHIYKSALRKLRDEANRIGKESEIGNNNLPQPLTEMEATELLCRLDTLYADVPVNPEDLVLDKGADRFSVPQFLEFNGDQSGARYLYDLAVSVINARSHLPVLTGTLKDKTDTLKFVEDYKDKWNTLMQAAR